MITYPTALRPLRLTSLWFRVYLEGQGHLVSRSMMGIVRTAIRVIGVINLLTKSP